MIKVFQPTDRNFSSNGDVVIQPLKAIVHKEDNGAYYLELECSTSYAPYIADRCLIVANTPTGEQAFRVTKPTIAKKKIKTKANHVFFDSANYLIADSYVVNKNGNDALDHLNNATEPQSEFTVSSDVQVIDSYRCVRQSLYEAIQVVLERWGGHLVMDNFNISLKTTIGTDNGVTIRYGKNLTSLTRETDWSDVCTKLLPVGYDGLLLNKLDPTQSIYMEADVQYDTPFTKKVTFTQEFVQEDYPTETAYYQAMLNDLRQQATAYLEEHSVPKVNYTLSSTMIEQITDVGDVIEVIDETIGINLMTNVIAFDYDCVLEKYTSLQFGNFKPVLSNLIGDITKRTEQYVRDETSVIQTTLGTQLEQATSQIWGVLGNSYVINEGDKILVVDRLPKESAVNVMAITSGGIGFSNTGINGTFNSAWAIDGTLNMQSVNVINLVADLIKGGTLKLGSQADSSGILELYDEQNNLIGLMDKTGLKMYGQDGSYVLMNQQVGFAGYDRNNNQIYWANGEEFHMKKSVVEEEITLCGKMRFIPITITENGTVVNDGIGLVSAIT